MQQYTLAHAYLPEGWASDVRIRIDDAGDIVSVEAGVLQGDDQLLPGFFIPGIPNIHSHAFQRALSGLTEHQVRKEDSFWSWRELMYSFAGRLDPDDVYNIAAQLYTEMLCAGYTAVAEFHYLHHQPDGRQYHRQEEMALAIKQAADDTGIRLTLLPALYMRAGFNETTVLDRQKRFHHLIESFYRLLEKLDTVFAGDKQSRLGVAFHSLRAVPSEVMDEVIAFITKIDPQLPVHIHIAEQRQEVEDCLDWSGQRPVEWLLNNQPVDSRWCLVHATHVTESELVKLIGVNAVVGLCPTTEANLGDGVFPLHTYLQNGGNIAIGSDSNISISPVEEFRWLEYGQRLMSHQRNVVADDDCPHTGENLLTRCLAGGAQACSMQTGAIAEGYSADIICLDAESSCLLEKHIDFVLDSFIFSGNTNVVKDVMVRGKWVVRSYTPEKAEEAGNKYRQTVKRLYSTLN